MEEKASRKDEDDDEELPDEARPRLERDVEDREWEQERRLLPLDLDRRRHSFFLRRGEYA